MRTNDVKFALRSLARTPGYTLAFVLTLGLGIGANAAIFSVLDGVLLRPLPHADGDRLVYLRQSAPLAQIENALFSVPEIADYRDQGKSFDGVAEFSAMTFNMIGGDEPRRVRAGVVTGNYFHVLGLHPVLGRALDQSDDGQNAAGVAVLTDRFWRAFFGADPNVIGRQVQMNGVSVTIVGVLQPAPPYPEQTDLYSNMVTSPHHMSATMQQDRLHRMTEVFARLKPGVAVEQARTEVESITARLHQEYPDAYDQAQGFAVSVTRLRTQLASRARPTVFVLLGAAAFVLLVACANVANLTLARLTRRENELALRTALGADKKTLRIQLLIETLIPSLLGGVLGLGLGYATLGILKNYAARFSVRADEITLDARVFGVAVVAALLAACFVAMVPRLPGGAQDLARALGSSRSTGDAGRRRMQALLVSSQVALSFILLIGTGLLLRTILHLDGMDTGLDTRNVLSLDIPRFAANRQGAEQTAAVETLLQQVSELPGVESSGVATRVPLRGGQLPQLEFAIEGSDWDASKPNPRADYRTVSPGYFETVGMKVIAGRVFDGRDRGDGEKVAVINESMAKKYFQDRDPLGRRIAWSGEVLRFIGLSGDWRQIVGVVTDVRDNGPTADPGDVIYQPISQEGAAWALFVRTATPPQGLAQPISEAIRRIEAGQPIENIATLEEVRTDAISPQRLNVKLLGAFAVVALLIAAVGVAGVLSFSVSVRRRELGIRASLGADRSKLLRGVIREGILLAAGGLIVGAFGAWALTRFLRTLLFGVEPTDPVTFIAVGVVLALVAVAASFLPAWSAAKTDPATVLRAE
jgi:predicted permease